jgi:hypothetical protein
VLDIGCGTGTLSILLAEDGFEVVAIVVRHVLWAMTDAESSLANWTERLRSGGTIILVEGHWLTGAGIPAAECFALAREAIPDARLLLMPDPVLWGGEKHDERYTVVGHRPSNPV